MSLGISRVRGHTIIGLDTSNQAIKVNILCPTLQCSKFIGKMSNVRHGWIMMRIKTARTIFLYRTLGYWQAVTWTRRGGGGVRTYQIGLNHQWTYIYPPYLTAMQHRWIVKYTSYITDKHQSLLNHYINFVPDSHASPPNHFMYLLTWQTCTISELLRVIITWQPCSATEPVHVLTTWNP
jgi:hypothetical protein